jgi:hypothetical protein
MGTAINRLKLAGDRADRLTIWQAEAEQAQEAREREREERQRQRAMTQVNWDEWNAWVDGRVDAAFQKYMKAFVEGTGGAMGAIRAGLRKEFQRELEVASGKLDIELRGLISGLRAELARLETELARRVASFTTETAGQDHLGEIHAGLRSEFRKELEVAIGKLGVELRELIVGLRAELARLETELSRRVASLATETTGQALGGEIHAGLRTEFRKELEVATGKLGVELRELIAVQRTELARLETELTRRVASLTTETAGLHLRGAYRSDQDYDRMDVVMLDGSSYVARCESPGPCPCEDWRILASVGSTGAQGIRGARGERGERGSPGPAGAMGPQGKPGASIVGWRVDAAHYAALPILSDGREGAALDLRPLFEQFCYERDGAA